VGPNSWNSHAIISNANNAYNAGIAVTLDSMKTVLITGAARRGGAAIARRVHQRGYHVVLHCRASSQAEAQALMAELNGLRADSASVWVAELEGGIGAPPRLDQMVGLVASASTYVESSLAQLGERLGRDMQSHLDGHLALVAHCKAALTANGGAIVAITDIAVERATRGYVTYQIAKGALATAVRVLAAELAPHVRVNAVAPGALPWPQDRVTPEEQKQRTLRATPLGRTGTFEELALAVEFLLFDATFTTGSTLNVDGGRSNFME
jgi:pteridine reductase